MPTKDVLRQEDRGDNFTKGDELVRVIATTVSHSSHQVILTILGTVAHKDVDLNPNGQFVEIAPDLEVRLKRIRHSKKRDSVDMADIEYRWQGYVPFWDTYQGQEPVSTFKPPARKY
jgi:hypothetical protein|tara:strand:- start:831 stop:1181 length:351 start_codon:yes stop_codon:yes gene_type:complete